MTAESTAAPTCAYHQRVYTRTGHVAHLVSSTGDARAICRHARNFYDFWYGTGTPGRIRTRRPAPPLSALPTPLPNTDTLTSPGTALESL